MIDKLISYAGLMSKSINLTQQPIDLTLVVDENIAVLRPMAENRNITLTSNIVVPVIIPAGDKDRISEALWHLMHNAIKFNLPGGQITIDACEQQGYLVISVKDTGIGIPANQQARVWDAFLQGADILMRGVEGLGLGLPFVHYVMTAHEGRATLESVPGKGSTFSLWFPVQARVVPDEAE